MHTKSVTDLYRLARSFLDEHEDDDDAWLLFRDEAKMRFSAEDDGDRAAYAKETLKIFDQAKVDAFISSGENGESGKWRLMKRPKLSVAAS